MREQDPIPVVSPSKLGEYTIVQEIAEGTFGKVKSVYLVSHPARSTHPCTSGRSYSHRSQGRNEVYLETRH